MFTRTAFISGRTPPVPEAFPESAAARRKQKEVNEKEESQPLPHSPSPVTSGASRSQSPIPPMRDLTTESSSNPIDKNASDKSEDLNQSEKISSIAAGKARSVEMVPKIAVEEATDADREILCQKVGEMFGEDITLVTIYPMLDIEHSDEAMITRVKDLLGPSDADDDVVLGEPFIAEHEHGMAIIDDDSICGILVTTTQSHRGQVRVADLANLKKRREEGRKGYEEIDVDPEKPWSSHVIIVKRSQDAVIQGRPTLRLFVRVAPGTSRKLAMFACEDAWLYRKIEDLQMPPVWHDYSTKD